VNAPLPPPYQSSVRRRARRWIGPCLGLLVVVGVGWLVWTLIDQQAGVRREAPQVPTIVPLPPPPPPPPKPPEPQKVEEKVAEIEPKPAEPITPKLDAPPKPADTTDPMTMDADGQAGGDAFNIGAGSGGGMSGGGGGGGGTGTYGQYLAYALQQILERDERTRRLAFRLSVDIWLDPNGRPTQVNLVESSGNPTTDAAVLAALRAISRLDERPTPGIQFPARVVISGRRPS